MSSHVPTHVGERDAAALAAGLAHRWVRGYSGWVGAEAAERRRAEITSDLWEQRADAHERGVAPMTVALSIAGRVVAGIPADLLWVRTQRLAMRGHLADRKGQIMNNLGHILARWWWVAGAAVLAVLGIIALFMGGTDLARLQVWVIVVALVAGIALRHWMPRTAASLVVFAAAVPAMLFWAPVVMVIGIATLVGAAIEVIRLTHDAGRRVVAALGLVGLVSAWVWLGSGMSAGPADIGQWGPLVLAIVGVGLLVGTGVHQRTAAVA